jgi:hypothetical protein
MKNVFISMLLMLSIAAKAQLIDLLPLNEKGEIYKTETVEFESFSQAKIFSALEQHFTDKMMFPNLAIKLNDKENGVLMMRGSQELKAFYVVMHYSLRVYVRDNRMKIEMYDIVYNNHNDPDIYFNKKRFYKKNGQPKTTFNRILNETLRIIENTITGTITGTKNNLTTTW